MGGERPTTRVSRIRALHSLAATLSAVWLSVAGMTACAVVSSPVSKESQGYNSQASGPTRYNSDRPFRSQPLAETRRIESGLEPGFTHCCGDVDYVMQVDCSDRLMRCYSNEDHDWHQTYGRNCKEALGQGCYEQGCLSVCGDF